MNRTVLIVLVTLCGVLPLDLAISMVVGDGVAFARRRAGRSAASRTGHGASAVAPGAERRGGGGHAARRGAGLRDLRAATRRRRDRAGRRRCCRSRLLQLSVAAVRRLAACGCTHRSSASGCASRARSTRVTPPVSAFAVESPSPMVALVGVFAPRLVAARSVIDACTREGDRLHRRPRARPLRRARQPQALVMASLPDMLRWTPVHHRDRRRVAPRRGRCRGRCDDRR